MAITISGVFRWTLRIAAASCVVAIAVGQMCAPAPVLRTVVPVRFVSIPTLGGEASLKLLDLQSGHLTSVELPGGDALENASCSPWKEESGLGQVVGRWRTRSGQGVDRVTTEFGLARYAFPSGECLDRVATEVLPQGSPCWYPGTTAKILFASADGGLYRFAFEGVQGLDAATSGRDLRPHPIVWKIAPPGEDERSVRIADPIWPTERVFGGRLFVSLRLQVRDGEGGMKFSAPRPWWLKLDAQGEAIEAAGPLDTEAATSESRLNVRFPRPFRTPDGSLRLASLTRQNRNSDWDLTISKLILGSDGTPMSEPGTEVVSARRCAFAPLASSSDGAWVYYVPLDTPNGWVLRTPTVPKGEITTTAKGD